MYGKIKKGIENNVSEDDKVPTKYKNEFAKDWIQLPFKIDGKPVMINPRLPLQSLNDIPRPTGKYAQQLFGNVTPFLKVPTELVANKNIFFGSPIRRGPTDEADAPQLLKMLGVDKITPEMKYILSNVVAFNNLNKVITPGADQMTNTMGVVGGIKPYAYDVDKYKEYYDKDRAVVLKKLLNDANEKEAIKRNPSMKTSKEKDKEKADRIRAQKEWLEKNKR